MTDRGKRRRHGLAGWIMLVAGVTLPGAIAIAAVVNPSLGWLQYPPTVGAPLAQTLVLVVGLALLAGTVGFALHRAWGWWLVVAWGLWSVFEIARSAVSNPFDISLSLPQVIAVLLLAHMWNRRRHFGVRFSGSEERSDAAR